MFLSRFHANSNFIFNRNWKLFAIYYNFKTNFIFDRNQKLFQINICFKKFSRFKIYIIQKYVLLFLIIHDRNFKTIISDNVIATWKMILFLFMKHFKNDKKWIFILNWIVVTKFCLFEKTFLIVHYEEFQNDENFFFF